MSKKVQYLSRTRKDIYKDAPVSGFGQRSPDFSTQGRKIDNQYAKHRDVVVVQACRTPYGRLGGRLSGYEAPELGALAIQEVLRRVEGKVTGQDVDYVIMGQVVPAGCGQVPGRQASILAGLPESVPCITVNKVCSSGIKTVDLGAQMIQLGRAEIVIAGGQESMSNCPYSLPEMRGGKKMGLPTAPAYDLMVYDGLWDPFYGRHMALHGSETSDEFGFTREENDAWALHSQQSAARAMAEGRLEEEIFPVQVGRGKKQEVMDTDEQPRPDTSLEGLAKLPP
ncbi:MAG: thiolase family protein, partial [Desulfovermiculus sp.]